MASQDTSLSIAADFAYPLDGKAPTYTVSGQLHKFQMNLISPTASFLVLAFDQLTFTAESRKKPDVQAQISGVTFAGPLEFIQTLQNYIHFGSSPSVDLSPSGVELAYTLGLPNIAVSAMSLQNIGLSAKLNLPFSGDPARLRIAFCERQHPFLLTVSLFGGGGFFDVALGLEGVETLEGSFEFGGNMALNIGVASGGVHLMGGIYYKMENDNAALTGYVRMGGEQEVLGLITVSAEFNMGLSYDTGTHKVWGQATLTVDIDIGLFSTSVDLTVEREFAGSAGDPTFADLMGQDEWLPEGYGNYWELYCEAFAPGKAQ